MTDFSADGGVESNTHRRTTLPPRVPERCTANDQKIEKLEARMEHELLEARSLIQLSSRQLQGRVATLAQRVQIIEKRLGLSA